MANTGTGSGKSSSRKPVANSVSKRAGRHRPPPLTQNPPKDKGILSKRVVMQVDGVKGRRRMVWTDK